MIFYENRLLADDSLEISYHIFFENWGRCCKICCLLQSLLALEGLSAEILKLDLPVNDLSLININKLFAEENK